MQLPNISKLYPPTLTMETSALDARQILSSLSNVRFMVSFCVAKLIGDFILHVSTMLQTKEQDLTEACDIVKSLHDILQRMRSNCEQEFHDIFTNASELAADLDIHLLMPRTVRKQTQRRNCEANTPEDYFKRSIFIPYVDSILKKLTDSLITHKQSIFNFQYFIPPLCCDAVTDDVVPAINFYKNLLAEHGDTETFCAGFRLWQQKWQGLPATERPTTAIDGLLKCSITCFLNIHILLSDLVTLPVTTASAERTFSGLRFLKTYLRPTCANDRLCGLTLMYCHRYMKIQVQK